MFSKIVVVDKAGLHPWAIEKLQELSVNPIVQFEEDPSSDEITLERIKDADCVFVSWRTPIRKNVLKECKSIRYIGMCCSLYDSKSANVDVDYANENNIVVKGIRDYGDEGVIEFIISETIQLLKGLGEHMWRDEPVELTRRKVGIIGMGTTGLMLANRFVAFGAQVCYYSRRRNTKADKLGYQYLPLNELLQTAEIVSTHLPKKTSVMRSEEFKHLGKGKILINTSLGLTFDKNAFEEWIAEEGNFAIFDGEGIKPHAEYFSKHNNIIASTLTTGFTREAKVRLNEKVLQNVNEFATELILN